MNWEMLGYVATLCGATQLIPEVLKALKTHHLRDVSWGMLAIMITGSFLWITYAIAKGIIPLAISAAMNGLMESTLIILKWHYSKRGHPLLHKRPVPQTQAIQTKD